MRVARLLDQTNYDINTFKGFNNVLALRLTTANGNSVKVFSCKLNNIGEKDLDIFTPILNKNGYPKDVLVLKLEKIINKTPKIYANDIDITNEDPLYSIMPKNIQEQDSFFQYLRPIKSILERFIDNINQSTDYDENFAVIEKITIETICGKFRKSKEAYKIVDELVTNDLRENGRKTLLEVAIDLKNSLLATTSSYAYRLIKTTMNSPF